MRRSTFAGLFTVLTAVALLLCPACREPGGPGGPPVNPPPDSGLVACPSASTQSGAALILPLGGTVSVAGSSVILPTGAVTVPTIISLRLPASAYMEMELRAAGLDVFVFELPLTVVMDYSRCASAALDAKPLRVWQIDPATKEKIADMGGVDSKQSHTVTFTTGHLSGYAIAN